MISVSSYAAPAGAVPFQGRISRQPAVAWPGADRFERRLPRFGDQPTGTRKEQDLAPVIRQLAMAGDGEPLDASLSQLAAQAGGRNTELLDPANNLRMALIKRPGGGHMFWADFNATGHPLLEQLSDRFSFHPFHRRDVVNDNIFYERPVIDKDSIQLTAYALSINGQGKLEERPVHIYAGDEFVITTHPGGVHGIDERWERLIETGAEKTPQQMVTSILREILHANGDIIDSLTRDLLTLTERLNRTMQGELHSPKAFRELTRDFLGVITKISVINQTVIEQKRVLDDLLLKNDDFNSPLIDQDGFTAAQREIQKQVDALKEQRHDSNNLIGLHEAAESNSLNHVMRRATLLATFIGIPTMIAGFLGMNVPIPGAQEATSFWLVSAGSMLTSGGLIAFFKRRGWV